MRCLVCRDDVVPLLDFGPQPISHHFLTEPGPEPLFPLVFGVCPACALHQLAPPVDAAHLVPKFDWVVHVEPSAHLADLAARLRELPGLSGASSVLGVSYKDDPLLVHLRASGFSRVDRIDSRSDLGLREGGVGMEEIRSRLSPEKAAEIARSRGPVDLLLVRHIFKYAHDPMAFLRALRHLTNPRGYVVLEISECRTALDAGDYSVMWEEHVLYLTPWTFEAAVRSGGFEVDRAWSYPNANEQCVILVARPAEPSPVAGPSREREEELRLGHGFAEGFASRRAGIRKRLGDLRRAKGKLAVLGAGHRSAAFVNLMGLKDLIAFVVDDHPKKQGLLMPGSLLPIHDSGRLVGDDVGVCLLAVKPEDEEKVAARNEVFLRRGGVFLSIFPRSPSWLLREG